MMFSSLVQNNFTKFARDSLHQTSPNRILRSNHRRADCFAYLVLNKHPCLVMKDIESIHNFNMETWIYDIWIIRIQVEVWSYAILFTWDLWDEDEVPSTK